MSSAPSSVLGPSPIQHTIFEDQEMPSESETDLAEPNNQVLPLLPQPRSATCSRPPCLKRVSDLSSVSASSLPTLGASVGTPSVASVFSFAAPRHFFAAQTLKRQVTFDASPPQAFVTFHPDDYDRTQIECTQGGSDFDLRLPSKCKRYNGEGGDEEEDASEVEEDHLEDGSPRKHGSTTTSGWTCLKSGSVLGSVGGTLTAGVPRPPVDSSAVSLPVHGFKSFGGLGQATSSDALGDRYGQSYASHREDDDIESDIEEVDNGAAAFEAAFIASKSPNVTPRASPRIIPRWARCTGYFEDVASHPEKTSAAQLLSQTKDTTPFATPIESNVPSPAGCTHTNMDDHAALSRRANCSGPQHMHNAALLMDVDQTPSATTEAEQCLAPQRQSRSPSPNECLNLSRSPAFAITGEGTVPGDASTDRVLQAEIPMVPTSPDPSTKGDVSSAFASLQCQDGSGESSSSSNDFQVCQSSPSPMSSRCSSTDLWSSLSSEDEGARSPTHGEWSSCTSPDMIPFKNPVAIEPMMAPLQVSPDHHLSTIPARIVPQPVDHVHHQDSSPPAFFTIPAADDADVSGEVVAGGTHTTTLLLPGPHKSVLRSALCLLEAEMSGSARHVMSEGGDMTPGSSSFSSGCSSTDEEAMSPSGIVKHRRKSSLSSFFTQESIRGGGEGRREGRSFHSGSSSRKTSLSVSREEREEGRSGSHSPSLSPRIEGQTPSRKRTSSKCGRSGSGSSSMRSGNCGRIRLSKEREEAEIEDEGALGGF